jgi:hypothetical protein
MMRKILKPEELRNTKFKIGALRGWTPFFNGVGKRE